MKKSFAYVLVLALVFVPLSLYAGTGYYNMAIMDTAQTMKAGKFMITAADDAGFWYSDYSKKWFMGNEPTGQLSYFIIEGLEASLKYNHLFLTHSNNTVSSLMGNGELDMKYAFGLGDIVRLSLGAGVGVPIDKDNGAITFTNTPVFQFIPEACLSINLGGLQFNIQLLDRFLMNDPVDAWLQAKASIAFDFNGFLAAFTGGFDTMTGSSSPGYMGGPEIIWNIGGPLQINLGVFAHKFFEGATVYRGVFRASLLL
jgi:hypothetical protein